MGQRRRRGQAPDPRTLVDAGYVGHAPQTVELVKSALAARRGSTGLARLINTHSHSDHIGGNAALQAAFGCRIVIPAGIERMVAEWDTHALLLDSARQRGDRFAHDAVIEPGAEFEMGGFAWKALPAPGHDMEALVYHCAEQRILISGDALWQDGFGIIFGEILGRKEALPATRATLEMIGRLAVDIVIPGHGAPLPAYLKSVPFFDHVNVTMLGFSDEDFASWLLGELLRSKSIEIKDGWILPTMAP
ncbi:MAG: MBL fold metallo-hydrolase [Betaproteobacteria bacterium]|nr:MBL fold metallo-hydrolase [Betaproteobacteria bacterium]